MSNFFEFKAEDTRCEVHSMEEYRGKVVLVVNTATQCGFTPQYDDLQNLYEKYQEEGNYVFKKDRNAGSVNRSCLRIQVTEDGQMQLMSVYSGTTKLNHESVKVELPDGTFALTSVIPYDGANNYRFVNAGNTTEVVTYKGKQMRSVADLVYNSNGAKIKVSYEGKRPFSFIMDNNTREAISASYELALVMSEIKQLQREKAIATKTIEILKKQIADHEHDSLDKKS